jgi:hypothetical protein
MIKYSKHSAILLFSVVLAVALGGCSTVEKNVTGIGSIFKKTDESKAEKGVFYSGSIDLPLYRSPGGVILKRLPKHTKLYREKQEKGFAYVRVDSTGETKWVENAKLIWRLPKPKSTEPALETKSQPAVESAAPQVAEPQAPQPAKTPESPPPAAVSPANAPAKPSVAPSIFNPY